MEPHFQSSDPSSTRRSSFAKLEVSAAESGNTQFIIGAAVLGLMAPVVVLGVLWVVANEALSFFADHHLQELVTGSWRPSAGVFGVLPLVSSTLYAAGFATAIAVAIGIPAAIRLVYFANRCERLICEVSLNLMAGLPSVIVGLAALALIVPYTGFTLAAGIVALFAMIFPVFTMLTVAALRQEGSRFWDTACALGYSPRTFCYKIALRAARPSLLIAATLSLGKAMGEATAISLVVGNIIIGTAPELFGPANTLTTAILKDHTAATGSHLSALYVLAGILAVLILAITILGSSAALAIRRRQA